MRPEKFESGPDRKGLAALGIPEEWIDAVVEAGYANPELLKEAKATAIHQQLNGLRKKLKMEIAALQLSDVEQWFRD
jgi:lysyl-tRNA synthetase class 2